MLEDANRAVYIPLVSERALKKPDEVLNAVLTIAGETVRLFPLDISSPPEAQWESWWVTCEMTVIQSSQQWTFCLRDTEFTVTAVPFAP